MDKDETEKKKLYIRQISVNKDNDDNELKVSSSIYRIKNNERNEKNENDENNNKIPIKKSCNSEDRNTFLKNDLNIIDKYIKPNSQNNSRHNSKDGKGITKSRTQNNRYSNYENANMSEKYDEFSERNNPVEKPKNSYTKQINNNDKLEEINESSEMRKIMFKSINKNNESSFLQEKYVQNIDDMNSNIKMKEHRNIDDNEFINKYYSSHDKDAKKYKIFIILFSIGIGLSVINVMFCIYLQLYGNQGSYIILGILSFILIVLYIFGIIFILKDKETTLLIIKKKENPEKIFHSKSRINFLLILYLLIISFYYHNLCSMVNSIFINNVKLSIRGKGYDINQWVEDFAGKNYNEIITTFGKLNISFIVFNWLNEIIIIIIVIYKIILIFNYRLLKSIIQVLCITAIQFGIFQIYLSLYCYRFRDVTSLEGIKLSWVTPGTMSTGFISIFLGIFGFYVIFMEDNKKILIFQLICFAQIILLCIFTSGLSDIRDKFYSYKHATCNSLFKFISEEYLLNNKLNGCSTKYLFSEETLNDFKCPKDRIMINWEKTERYYQNKGNDEMVSMDDEDPENNSNKVYFGCINQSCCLQIYFEIKNRFEFLLLLSISNILYFIIIFIFSIYIRFKINSNLEEEISEKINILIISILTIFAIFIILIFIFTLPNSSNQSLLNDIDNNEVSDSLSIIKKDLTMIDKDILFEYTNDSFISVKQGNIKSFKYNIIFDFIDKNEYEFSYYDYTITSSDLDINVIVNKLSQIKYKDYNSYSFSNSTKKIQFKSESNIINELFDYINIVPYHPLKNEILLNIDINGIFIRADESNFIDNKNNINNDYNNIIITKEIIESNYNENFNHSIVPIIKKEIDFSIMDKQELFYIKGNIINDNGNSLVNVYNFDYNIDPIYSVRTYNNGSFIIGPIYKLLNTKAIYNLYIEISKILVENITIYNNNELTFEEKYTEDTRYCKYYDFIKIGIYGFHSNKLYSINNIYLPENKAGSMNIIGKVLEYNVLNEPLSTVNVKLFYGDQINTINEIIENDQNNINSSFLNDNNIPSTTTNENGEYSFNINKNGEYMIIYIKEDYYLEKNIFTISNISSGGNFDLGTMRLIELFNSGKIVVKLEWQNKPPDLDLVCRFQVTKNNYCYTFFGNKKCGESEFFFDSREKNEISSEIIEISEFSDYVYLFYVRKYFDSSNGITLNEYKIDGVEPQPKINFTDIDTKYDENLTNTMARILVYSNGYRIPALKINVPGFIKNETNNVDYNYWVAFCINGKEGINSLKVVNDLLSNEPAKNICSSYYEENNMISFSD